MYLQDAIKIPCPAQWLQGAAKIPSLCPGSDNIYFVSELKQQPEAQWEAACAYVMMTQVSVVLPDVLTSVTSPENVNCRGNWCNQTGERCCF